MANWYVGKCVVCELFGQVVDLEVKGKIQDTLCQKCLAILKPMVERRMKNGKDLDPKEG